MHEMVQRAMTVKQLQVARCLLNGMTVKESAAHLHTSENAVKSRMLRLYHLAGVPDGGGASQRIRLVRKLLCLD